MLPCQIRHLIKLRYDYDINNRVSLSKKQDRIIKMTRQHREVQEKIMIEYQKREKEFLKRIQEELIRKDDLDIIKEEEIHT
jgi:hypothetical protein